jgi:hypothetical protein
LASGPDFIATQEGIYDVIITKNIADIEEIVDTTQLVSNRKSSPAIANIEVSDSFADIINITATVLDMVIMLKLDEEYIKTTLFF